MSLVGRVTIELMPDLFLVLKIIMSVSTAINNPICSFQRACICIVTFNSFSNSETDLHYHLYVLGETDSYR